MRNILMIKVGALGDVVRTTSLLSKFKDDNVTWFTSDAARPLLQNNPFVSRVLSKYSINYALDRKYDIIINLDEEQACCDLAAKAFEMNPSSELYGFYTKGDVVHHSGNDTAWLDMSLSGRFPKEPASDPRWKNKADEMKWLNRRSYEDHIFSLLGFKFNGEEYVLGYDSYEEKGLVGMQNPLERNTKWPMKKWNNYSLLAKEIQKLGYNTMFLRIHEKLEDHIRDIAACEFIICEDSLPMQLAIALKKPTIAFFICTSPNEIYGYGRVKKIVSPNLKEYFYRRDFDPNAASTIPMETVLAEFKELIAKK